MKSRIIVLTLLAMSSLFSAKAAFSADVAPALTQGDWMARLVDALDYGYGLPDQPNDADYAALLNGRRTWRFEAEEVRDPADLVGINTFKTFGPFSGSAWVAALSAPTPLHLHLFVPHAGTYRLSGAFRLSGHRLKLGDSSYTVEANLQQLSRVELGDATLKPGEHLLIVEMPPNSAIDYVELNAPQQPLIAPFSGWRPKSPLTPQAAAETVVRALALEALLPPGSDALRFPAEKGLVDRERITDQQHLGEPEDGSWVRAGASPLQISLPLEVKKSGIYDLLIRGEADRPVTVRLNDSDPLTLALPPYLDRRSVTTLYLDAGSHWLDIDLPPRGGLDTVSLIRRQDAAQNVTKLIGLSADSKTLAAGDAERLLTLLSRLAPRD